MNHKVVAVLALAVALGGSTLAFAAPKAQARGIVVPPSVAAKLQPGLPEALRAAKPGDRLTVTFTMALQASREEVDRASRPNDPDVRRQNVVSLLQRVAEQGQRGLLAALGEVEATNVQPFWISSVVMADVTPAALIRLAGRADVAQINLNQKRNLLPPYRVEEGAEILSSPTWGLNMIQAPRVWNELGITGRGAIVAVLDTGACRHSDLNNRFWVNPGEVPGNGIDDDRNGYIDDINGWNFARNNGTIEDFGGHGTHVSGTVVGDGTGGSQIGVAPGANLMYVNVRLNLSDENFVVRGIQYAAANGANAWNGSFGWRYEWNPNRRLMRDTVLNAMAIGCTPVIAAGNEGNSYPPFSNVRTPGDVPEAITAGAVTSSDTIAGFSSRGPVTWQSIDGYRDWPFPPGKLKPTVSAPGDGVSSARVCSGYTSLSGTSMASPHIAGTTALMYEANRFLRPEQVKDILIRTSLDRGDRGWDNVFGAGRIDAYLAVLEAIRQRSRHFAESYSVVRGQRTSRDRMGDVYRDDETWMTIAGRAPFAAADPWMRVEFTTTSRVNNPNRIAFFAQMNVSAQPSEQFIELWDNQARRWVVIDQRQTSNTDMDAEGVSTDNVARFVGQDKQVRARLSVFDRGVVAPSWNMNLDWAFFDIQ
jgi:subtilisin family serine protease